MQAHTPAYGFPWRCRRVSWRRLRQRRNLSQQPGKLHMWMPQGLRPCAWSNSCLPRYWYHELKYVYIYILRYTQCALFNRVYSKPVKIVLTIPSSDFDECFNSTVCGPDSVCTNTPGLYTCACQPGYIPTEPEQEPSEINLCIGMCKEGLPVTLMAQAVWWTTVFVHQVLLWMDVMCGVERDVSPACGRKTAITSPSF